MLKSLCYWARVVYAIRLSIFRSAIECLELCQSRGGSCPSFNYKKNFKLCELFSSLQNTFTVDQDCIHYQVRTHHRRGLLIRRIPVLFKYYHYYFFIQRSRRCTAQKSKRYRCENYFVHELCHSADVRVFKVPLLIFLRMLNGFFQQHHVWGRRLHRCFNCNLNSSHW